MFVKDCSIFLRGERKFTATPCRKFFHAMRLERCKEILCWQCVTGCSMSRLIAHNTKDGCRFIYFVQHLTAGLHWCLLQPFFVLLCGQIQPDIVPESAKTDTKSGKYSTGYRSETTFLISTVSFFPFGYRLKLTFGIRE